MRPTVSQWQPELSIHQTLPVVATVIQEHLPPLLWTSRWVLTNVTVPEHYSTRFICPIHRAILIRTAGQLVLRRYPRGTPPRLLRPGDHTRESHSRIRHDTAVDRSRGNWFQWLLNSSCREIESEFLRTTGCSLIPSCELSGIILIRSRKREYGT